MSQCISGTYISFTFLCRHAFYMHFLFLISCLFTLNYLVKGFESSEKPPSLYLGDEMCCRYGFYLEEEALKFQNNFPYFKPY